MERKILAAASFYNQKYYISPEFSGLPRDVQQEIQVMAVVTAEKIHGIFTIGFDEDGEMFFETMGAEDDFDYDDIGAGLEVSRLRREQRELMEALKLWYSIFCDEE